MGHEVRGVIAATSLAKIVASEPGFALVPYTSRSYDHFLGRHGEQHAAVWDDGVLAWMLLIGCISAFSSAPECRTVLWLRVVRGSLAV